MALVSRARGTFYGQRTGGAPHRRAVFIGFGPLAGGAAGARERSLKSTHFVAPLSRGSRLAGRVLRPGPRLAIGTTRFCAAQHVFRGEGGPRRQAGPAARGQISPQAIDIAINSSKETD